MATYWVGFQWDENGASPQGTTVIAEICGSAGYYIYEDGGSNWWLPVLEVGNDSLDEVDDNLTKIIGNGYPFTAADKEGTITGVQVAETWGS